MNKNVDFSEFEPISAKQWKQSLQASLKGADYQQTLVWESLEGIHVKPFYHADEDAVSHPEIYRNQDDWKIVSSFFTKNEKLANRNMLHAIENGATAVWLLSEEPFDIEKLFAKIEINNITIYVNLRFYHQIFYEKLLRFLTERQATFYLNFDPIGQLARSGNWFANMKTDLDLVVKIQQNHPNVPVIGADLSVYQEAGANMVQQLAYGMAQIHEYLSRLKEPSTTLCLQVAVGSNYFFEIAKIRALRLLYATLARSYQAPENCHILAKPSLRNKTLYDYNVNMLRTTTECMSAVLGTADAVCNLAYDVIFHKDNEFGQRISRNQLLILKSESYFHHTLNPTDGSYYVESLTRQLAEKALQIFKDIEAGEGLLTQLKNGTIQRKINESHQKELDALARGNLTLIGTTKHPNPDDRMKDSCELYPFLKIKARKTLIQPIHPRRLAENIEKDRLEKEKLNS
ncbi:MAG: methylmalonyl-CoA mutase subunit beta [Flavobacteriaceae bacterium]|nr:methylmalonyl-CoA mutase subunit beta [Flavobacteriaceae bacterium]